MWRTSQSQPAPFLGSASPGQGSFALADLAGRFARFRQEHPPRTRIPADLRAAALAALEKGAAAGDLYRMCGVSWSQVIAWRAAGGGRAPESAKPRGAEGTGAGTGTGVRVFSVVDEKPVHRPEPRLRSLAGAAGPELELRLGPWSVIVRLEDGPRAEGDEPCFP